MVCFLPVPMFTLWIAGVDPTSEGAVGQHRVRVLGKVQLTQTVDCSWGTVVAS